MTENIYTPTEHVSQQTLIEERVARRRKWLRRCGLALLVLSLFNLFIPILTILGKDLLEINFVFPIGTETGTKAVYIGIGLTIGALIILVNTIIALGAYHMWRTRESRFIRLAAFAALFPCTVLMWPFSLPFGLTAFIILLREKPELLLDPSPMQNPSQEQAAEA